MTKKELIKILSQVDDNRIVLSEECDDDLMITCEKKQDWTTSNDFGPPFVV